MNAVTSPNVARDQQKAPRLKSLDQFRGFTVVGMLLVNYFGGYAVCPQLLKHTNDYCSFADTIMPQFLFAVGFSLRLTFGRRMQNEGSCAAYLRMIRRLLGLVLISLVIYQVDPRAASWAQLRQMSWGEIWGGPLKRDWFQTLMHIAVTSLWILPVVHRGARVRIAWMVSSSVLHVVLSHWFNFAWTNTDPNAIDGGPLGFLTWSVPAILGTLACDYFVGQPSASTELTRLGTVRSTSRIIMVSLTLMVFGYVLSCGTRLYDVAPLVLSGDSEAATGATTATITDKRLVDDPVWPKAERWQAKFDSARAFDWLAEPPFVQPPPRPDSAATRPSRHWNYWMMSQRAGTLSYLVFAAGFSLMVFTIFYVACDMYQVQVPLFRTFGTNALVAYILHNLISDAVQPFFPKDSPAAFAYAGLGLYFVVNWLFVQQLEKQGAYLRV